MHNHSPFYGGIHSAYENAPFSWIWWKKDKLLQFNEKEYVLLIILININSV